MCLLGRRAGSPHVESVPRDTVVWGESVPRAGAPRDGRGLEVTEANVLGIC